MLKYETHFNELKHKILVEWINHFAQYLAHSLPKKIKKPQTIKRSQFSLSLSLGHGNYIVYAQHTELSQFYCASRVIWCNFLHKILRCLISTKSDEEHSFGCKKNKAVLFLELLPFLLRGLMLLLTAAAFLYPKPGFGAGGRNFSGSGSPTASNTWQWKILVWVPAAKCWTAQKLFAELQKKKI